MKFYYEEPINFRYHFDEVRTRKDFVIKNDIFNRKKNKKVLYYYSISDESQYNLIRQNLNKYISLDENYQGEKLEYVEHNNNIISAYDLIEALKKEMNEVYFRIDDLMNYVKTQKNFFDGFKCSILRNTLRNIIVNTHENFIEIDLYFKAWDLIFDTYSSRNFRIIKDLSNNKISYSYDKDDWRKNELNYLVVDLEEKINRIFEEVEYLINNYQSKDINEVWERLVKSLRISDNLLTITPSLIYKRIKDISVSISLNKNYLTPVYHEPNKSIFDAILEDYNILKYDTSDIINENKDEILKKIPVDIEKLTNYIFINDKSIPEIFQGIIDRQINKQEYKVKKITKDFN